VRAIKELNGSTGVELLVPDFNGEPARLEEVFESGQKCWRTTSKPCRASSSGSGQAFTYQRSLGVLTAARDFGLVTKSNLILGLARPPTSAHRAGRPA